MGYRLYTSLWKCRVSKKRGGEWQKAKRKRQSKYLRDEKRGASIDKTITKKKKNHEINKIEEQENFEWKRTNVIFDIFLKRK